MQIVRTNSFKAIRDRYRIPKEEFERLVSELEKKAYQVSQVQSVPNIITIKDDMTRDICQLMEEKLNNIRYPSQDEATQALKTMSIMLQNKKGSDDEFKFKMNYFMEEMQNLDASLLKSTAKACISKSSFFPTWHEFLEEYKLFESRKINARCKISYSLRHYQNAQQEPKPKETENSDIGRELLQEVVKNGFDMSKIKIRKD